MSTTILTQFPASTGPVLRLPKALTVRQASVSPVAKRWAVRSPTDTTKDLKATRSYADVRASSSHAPNTSGRVSGDHTEAWWATSPAVISRRRSANDLCTLVQNDQENINRSKSEADAIPYGVSATLPAPGAAVVGSASGRREQGFKGKLRESVMETQSLQRAQAVLDKDLLSASAKGRLSTVSRLLKTEGCNPNCRTKHGLTPLHYAALHGYVDVARALLEGGADSTLTNAKGLTPLDFARNNQQDEVAALLTGHLSVKAEAKQQETDSVKSGVLVADKTAAGGKETNMPSHYIWVSVVPAGQAGPFFWPHMLYNVTMTTRQSGTGSRSFTVKRRFSDFHWLAQRLLELCTTSELYDRLQPLQPHKVFLGSTSKHVVEERAQLFQRLLTEAANANVPEMTSRIIDFMGDEN